MSWITFKTLKTYLR